MIGIILDKCTFSVQYTHTKVSPPEFQTHGQSLDVIRMELKRYLIGSIAAFLYIIVALSHNWSSHAHANIVVLDVSNGNG